MQLAEGGGGDGLAEGGDGLADGGGEGLADGGDAVTPSSVLRRLVQSVVGPVSVPSLQKTQPVPSLSVSGVTFRMARVPVANERS